MIQLELFLAASEKDFEEEEAYRIDDDDGGTESDFDPCDRCDCPRVAHDASGCQSCGKCKKFKES